MTDSPAWLDLDGAANARDLAGLTTPDGRRVQPGRLIRSDNLQDLTPGDVRRLVDGLGVRTILDLRTGIEVDREGPGPMLAEPRVSVRHLSLVPEAGAARAGTDGSVVLPWQQRDDDSRAVTRPGTPPVTPPGPEAVYRRYLDERGDAVVAALRAIAHDPGATLVHCAAGKDRTGTVVALALAAVGVERGQIVADYARSAERIEQILTRLVATPTYAGDVGDRLSDLDVDRHRPRAETMAAFLTALDTDDGGPLGWLTAHGWTDADTDALGAALLDPTG